MTNADDEKSENMKNIIENLKGKIINNKDRYNELKSTNDTLFKTVIEILKRVYETKENLETLQAEKTQLHEEKAKLQAEKDQLLGDKNNAQKQRIDIENQYNEILTALDGEINKRDNNEADEFKNFFTKIKSYVNALPDEYNNDKESILSKIPSQFTGGKSRNIGYIVAKYQ